MNNVTKMLAEKAESHAVSGTLPAEYSRIVNKVESLKKLFKEESHTWDLVNMRSWERDMSYFTLYREELRRLIVGEHPAEETVYNQLDLFI